MNPGSTFSTHHMPTELNMKAVEEWLRNNPNSSLGDLLQPYLVGQFSSAPEPEEGYDAEERGRSYQETTDSTSTGDTQYAPFPLSPEEAESHLEYMRGIEGQYIMPDKQARGGIDPSRQYLSNALRVLQGRLRQNENIDFKPQRTAAQRGSGTRRGVTQSSHADRQTMYANTPVSLIPQTTGPQPAGKVGVIA